MTLDRADEAGRRASPDRVDQFEADIATGPAALSDLLDGWRPPFPMHGPTAGLGGRSRIAFAGLGSSRYAALIVAAAVRHRGGTAWVEYPSSGTPTSPGDDLALVAVSASGRTREVLEAAERHRGRSLVIAVTNGPTSRLAAVADITVDLRAGEERSAIACRTFRATIAALALITGLATAAQLRPAVTSLARRLDSRDTWLPPIADALDAAPSIDVMADAAQLGLAEQAALMLREGPRLPARACETSDWLHTGVYLALPGHRALLFPGSAADDEVADTVRRRGGVVVQAVAADTDPIRRSLVDSVVAEVVAAELWRRVPGGT